MLQSCPVSLEVLSCTPWGCRQAACRRKEQHSQQLEDANGWRAMESERMLLFIARNCPKLEPQSERYRKLDLSNVCEYCGCVDRQSRFDSWPCRGRGMWSTGFLRGTHTFPALCAVRQDANDPPRAGSFDYIALLRGHQAVLVKRSCLCSGGQKTICIAAAQGKTPTNTSPNRLADRLKSLRCLVVF